MASVHSTCKKFHSCRVRSAQEWPPQHCHTGNQPKQRSSRDDNHSGPRSHPEAHLPVVQDCMLCRRSNAACANDCTMTNTDEYTLAWRRRARWAMLAVSLVCLVSVGLYFGTGHCSWISAGGALIAMVGVIYGLKTQVATWASVSVELSSAEKVSFGLIVVGSVLWGYGGLLLSIFGDWRCWP